MPPISLSPSTSRCPLLIAPGPVFVPKKRRFQSVPTPPAAEIQNEARLTAKPLEDIAAVCSAVMRLCKRAVEAPKPAQPVAGALQTSYPSANTPNPLLQTANPSIEDPKPSNHATGAQGNPAGGSAVGVPGTVDSAVTVPRPFKTAFELDVPADARKAFDSGKFRERIAKNAQK